jgi:hypothetical protein
MKLQGLVAIVGSVLYTCLDDNAGVLDIEVVACVVNKHCNSVC